MSSDTERLACFGLSPDSGEPPEVRLAIVDIFEGLIGLFNIVDHKLHSSRDGDVDHGSTQRLTSVSEVESI